jgi:hypothetical protein
VSSDFSFRLASCPSELSPHFRAQGCNPAKIYLVKR